MSSRHCLPVCCVQENVQVQAQPRLPHGTEAQGPCDKGLGLPLVEVLGGEEEMEDMKQEDDGLLQVVKVTDGSDGGGGKSLAHVRRKSTRSKTRKRRASTSIISYVIFALLVDVHMKHFLEGKPHVCD